MAYSAERRAAVTVKMLPPASLAIAVLSLIEEARAAGARLSAVCAELGPSARTVQRWLAPDGSVREDTRPTTTRPAPANRLSEAASWPPATRPSSPACRPARSRRGWRTVGTISVRNQPFTGCCANGARQVAAPVPATRHPPPTWPCQLWNWVIPWLPGPALGMVFHLYLILDIRSRKIAGREVHDRASSERAAPVIERAVWAEGRATRPPRLHADNGSPMKASTLRVTLERLGVTASHSRPRVSNDIPFSEALIRTCKYVPTWPERGFESLEAARTLGDRFHALVEGRARPQRAAPRHPR